MCCLRPRRFEPRKDTSLVHPAHSHERGRPSERVLVIIRPASQARSRPRGARTGDATRKLKTGFRILGFLGFLGFRVFPQLLRGSERASKQASKQASLQASKRASERASARASKQAGKRAGMDAQRARYVPTQRLMQRGGRARACIDGRAACSRCANAMAGVAWRARTALQICETFETCEMLGVFGIL